MGKDRKDKELVRPTMLWPEHSALGRGVWSRSLEERAGQGELKKGEHLAKKQSCGLHQHAALLGGTQPETRSPQPSSASWSTLNSSPASFCSDILPHTLANQWVLRRTKVLTGLASNLKSSKMSLDSTAHHPGRALLMSQANTKAEEHLFLQLRPDNASCHDNGRDGR